MNDLATIPQKDGLTPLLSKSLDSQALKKHRAMVALELEVLAKTYDRFGWERDRGSYAHDRMLTNWMDALQDYPLKEIQAACAQAVEENPNKMPNQGHVKSAIIAARAKMRARVPQPVSGEVMEPRVTRERAAEIMAERGIENRFKSTRGPVEAAQ